jgi:hypothetical protein
MHPDDRSLRWRAARDIASMARDKVARIEPAIDAPGGKAGKLLPGAPARLQRVERTGRRHVERHNINRR